MKLSLQRATDPMDLGDKQFEEYLQNKDYQFTDGSLENRLTIYKKRYSINFGAFLSRTNEKEISVRVITNFLNNLFQMYPRYYETGIRIFDIGFGDGQFSYSVINNIIQLLPADSKNNVVFSGIDPQEKFVSSINDLMNKAGIKTDARVGCFMDQFDPECNNSPNLIMASHVAYFFSDVKKFLERVQALAQPNSIAVFMHSSQTPIDKLKENFRSFLKKSTTNDTLARIEEALKTLSLNYEAFEFHPHVSFPQLNEKEWQEFVTTQFVNVDAEYSELSANALELKKLIEFFIQDSLEVFTAKDNKELIMAFKVLLKKYNYRIPLTNRMQIVVSRGSESKLREYVHKSVQAMIEKYENK